MKYAAAIGRFCVVGVVAGLTAYAMIVGIPKTITLPSVSFMAARWQSFILSGLGYSSIIVLILGGALLLRTVYRKNQRIVILSVLLIVPAFIVMAGAIAAYFAVALFFAASAVIGRAIYQKIMKTDADDLAGIAVSCAIGIGINGYGIWLCMHMPVNYTAVYVAVLFIELIVWKKHAERMGGMLREKLERSWSPAQFFIIGFVLVYLPYALSTNYCGDELLVHLYIPKTVALFHQFHFSPEYKFSFDHAVIFKGVFSALYMIGGEYAVRLFNLFLFALGFAALESCIRRMWNEQLAFFTLLTALSLPFLNMQLLYVFIDSGAFYYGTMLTLFVLQLRTVTMRSVAILCLLAVLAYLVKQQGVFVIIPAGIIVLVLQYRQKLRVRTVCLSWIVGAGICTAFLAVPIVSSYVSRGVTGIIFFDEKLFGRSSDPKVVAHAVLPRDARWQQRPHIGSIVDITFAKGKYVEYGGMPVGISFFVFALFVPFIFFRKKIRSLGVMLAVFCLFSVAFWFILSGPYLRYLGTMQAALACVIGLTVHEIMGFVAPVRTMRFALMTIFMLITAVNFVFQFRLTSWIGEYPFVSVLAGRAESSAPLAPLRRLFRCAGELFGRDALGYLYGQETALYFADTRIEGGVHSYGTIRSEINRCPDARSLYDTLFHKGGYTYVIAKDKTGDPIFDSAEFHAIIARVRTMNGYSLYAPRSSVLLSDDALMRNKGL